MPQNKIVVEQQSAKKESLPSWAAGASAPDDSGRVVIESVWPEIDGGRTAVKRVIRDWLEVSADVFSDGHAIIMAEFLYRALDENSWCRLPMRKGDNDRWSARFELDRLLPYLYTIEAWCDPYASWADEARKKIAAERDVTVETVDGLQLNEMHLLALVYSSANSSRASMSTPAACQDADSQTQSAGTCTESCAHWIRLD